MASSFWANLYVADISTSVFNLPLKWRIRLHNSLDLVNGHSGRLGRRCIQRMSSLLSPNGMCCGQNFSPPNETPSPCRSCHFPRQKLTWRSPVIIHCHFHHGGDELTATATYWIAVIQGDYRLKSIRGSSVPAVNKLAAELHCETWSAAFRRHSNRDSQGSPLVIRIGKFDRISEWNFDHGFYPILQ